MKVVINVCSGGFSLSARAVKRLAELNGRECYFFDFRRKLPVSLEELEANGNPMWSAFDIPNLDEVRSYNARYKKHYLTSSPEVRHDPKLIQVVEELGSEGASGSYAELQIVEIPDGTDYEIEEYDGNEHIAEKHQTWR